MSPAYHPFVEIPTMLRAIVLACGIASLGGCSSTESAVPYTFEEWVSYSYTSLARDGKVLTRGTISIAPLKPGSRRFFGRWEVRAEGKGDLVSYQVGSGLLDGHVSGNKVWIEFHPETAGTDHGFELEGELTSTGAKGQWGVTNEGGVHANQGAFSLTRKP
jgi:hypothetical protein